MQNSILHIRLNIFFTIATFQINIGRLKNLTSLSNMPKRITGQKMNNNIDYAWDIYQTTPKMSTYTIGMAVLSNYSSMHKEYGKRNFSTWRESRFANYRDFIVTLFNLETTIKFLSFYESYFNMSDELPKTDSLHVLHGTYGAMENWGLIMYFDIRGRKIPDRTLIAHELAHYWMGNLVTCKNWNE